MLTSENCLTENSPGIDKESDVAMQASSRNDGMIHPGIASHVGTKRGEMNVRGNAMYTQVCKELSVPFERWSNLILYSEKIFGLFSTPVFAYREKHLGVEGRKISREELHRIEPNITDEAIGAFEFPSSGVLSPYKLTVAFAENAVENGAKVSLDTIVTSIDTEGDKIVAVHTNRGTVRPKAVINAAGVFSDKIAEMAGDRFFTTPTTANYSLITVRNETGAIGQLIPAVTATTTAGLTDDGILHIILGNA